MAIDYEEVEYGFRYGAATVTRLCSDEAKGWVVISVETPKSRVQVYVTKTGKVRVHGEGGEWLPEGDDE